MLALFPAAIALLAPLLSDHREAPFIRQDAPADLADLYAFVNPNDTSKVVLAMTVNGFTAPPENITYNFADEVRYDFQIDNDGDAIQDHTISISTHNGQFTVSLSGLGQITGAITQPSEEVAPNPAVIVSGLNGVRAFAGPRDDPFFFDVVGFFRTLGGTGTFSGSDGFAGYNVSAIVVEVPLSYLTQSGAMPLQIWAETHRQRITGRFDYQESQFYGSSQLSRGAWYRVDRVGNPAINTALVPAGKKDFFNVSSPSNDGLLFANDLVASLTALGTSPANIGVLASVAVPDTLKLNPAQPMGYPNGRLMQDDVMDTLFHFIFNQGGVTDSVPSNDVAFISGFPFLAPPHQP